MQKLQTATTLALATVLTFFATSAVNAQSCGDTLTASTVLNSSLSCSGAGLIIGADGITLDCGNFVIRGSGVDVGIEVLGRTDVIILNCLVSNFATGYSVNDSSDGVLRNNGAMNNASNGFHFVDSRGNGLHENNSSSNLGRGFAFSDSNGNFLFRNSAFMNGFRGFDFSGISISNVLIMNTASQNTSAGFILSSRSGFNTLLGNAAFNNESEGFAMYAPDNYLAFNESGENGYFGYTDITNPFGNTYQSNTCEANVAGGSSPAGLCTPQP